MSDILTCGGCRQTAKARDAQGWWHIKQEPPTRHGVGARFDFCSVACASELLRDGDVGRVDRRAFPRAWA